MNTAFYRNVCHVISKREVFLASPLLMPHIRVKTPLIMTLTFRVKEPPSRLGGLAHSSEKATMCRSVTMGRVRPEGALVEGEKILGCLPLHCLPASLSSNWF